MEHIFSNVIRNINKVVELANEAVELANESKRDFQCNKNGENWD